MAEEKTRYSDAELAEFKELILKKLETARADYELLRATITHTGDNDTEDTSPTFKGQAHSQGAPDESAPRHRVHRG